jgi:hypothetical protein
MTPIITLLNGLRVANMSSPHPFNFTTGEVLPACSADEAQRLKLDSVEIEEPGIKGTIDIRLQFKLNEVVTTHLHELNAREDVDIILVPFPVLQAMKDSHWAIGKCRVIRVADRVSKAICCDRFCI